MIALMNWQSLYCADFIIPHHFIRDINTFIIITTQQCDSPYELTESVLCRPYHSPSFHWGYQHIHCVELECVLTWVGPLDWIILRDYYTICTVQNLSLPIILFKDRKNQSSRLDILKDDKGFSKIGLCRI